MCEPISATTAAYIAIASTVATVAGAAVSIKASTDAADYQAQVARNQAQLTKWNAEIAEQEKREETRQIIGKQRAEFAARGLNPNFGTAANVQAQTAEIGELDALTIRVNAKNEAAGLRSQADAAKALGSSQAWGTALTTAGQVAGKWATPTYGGEAAGNTKSPFSAGAQAMGAP